MSFFEAIILGTVQGITEFLPVSSTGHLIIARDLLGLQTELGLTIDATLHFATAFAVLIYFRKDLLQLATSIFNKLKGVAMERDMTILFYAIMLGTIPGVIAGMMLEEKMETTFRNPTLVAYVLIAGSGLFLFAEYVSKKYTEHTELTVKNGIIIGLFQALALVPGTSRSGATISGGMLLGLTREKSARFAFLLSFPIIIGAGSKKLIDLGGAGIVQSEWFIISVGAFMAFATGLACIHYLLKFLKNHTLLVFVVYRIILATIVLLTV